MSRRQAFIVTFLYIHITVHFDHICHLFPQIRLNLNLEEVFLNSKLLVHFQVKINLGIPCKIEHAPLLTLSGVRGKK